MKRKLLAVLLVLVMALSVMPLAASATETDPCANGHTWGTEYTYNTEYHTKNCTVCGDFMAEPHSMVDNKCVVCGLVQGGSVDKDHCNHFITVVEYNDTQHHFKCDCGDSDYWQDHTLNSEGVCTYPDCGYGSEKCSHANAKYDFDQYNHWKQCPDCGVVLDRGTEHPSTGCDICGFSPCTGGHTFGTSGYEKHRCQVCSFCSPCEDNDNNCVCDICGYDCHSISELLFNEEYHWSKCDTCGKVMPSSKHEFNNDGICDYCGYNKSTGTVTPPTNPDTPTPPSGGNNDPRLDNVPRTGDISVYFLAAALTLFATTALTVKKYVF